MSIKEANQKAIEIVLNAQPTLVDIQTAIDVVPGMTKKTILHAGPPFKNGWESMSGPVRGAVIGALLYEGLAKTKEEAIELAKSGEIIFDSCHHHNAVGPMAGIMSASMPVWVVENTTYGNRAYCTLNEGLGKVLRYGAYSPDVIERLRWMENILAPVLKKALELVGPINLKTLIAEALQMGDEGHNRNRAGTSLLIRKLAPGLVKSGYDAETVASVFEFMNGNDHFFLNLTMPACKATMDPAHGIENSTLVSTMARNGTEFGIRVSGLGDRWFTAPAEIIDGLYFPGYGPEDANPDVGDSVITETTGIGGFAMAAAPAITQFVGGTPEDALKYTNAMYEITLAENNAYLIPAMDFRGTPTGIDIRKVVESGILPIINTGIAHKEPGVGQVGAGLVRPPMKCFEDAVVAFAEKMQR
ncbi:hypothetical protein BBF96_04300 [Anoxybacter fermentans]|uniref:DUF1116 domain-containing protein n=1 Tax=Anoxybacter fermentans TaxID=1323375 RepID=A0A3Q9HPD1_9FIRM|nr:DUF1116 domain-containing protein [Anoxybacter fermentans]AZR72678.1 hypothetical protein BBF96_04300 [Anoxybacter fermentans]